MPAGVFFGGGATVVMDPPPVVYVKVFRIGSGPDRYARRNARKVAIMAKAIAPKRTGHLAGSIGNEQNRNEHGRFTFGYKVYSNASYSKYVHEGTGPSVRTSAFPKMKFQGTNGHPGMIYTGIVYHPGTPKNPFLVKSLIAMAR